MTDPVLSHTKYGLFPSTQGPSNKAKSCNKLFLTAGAL